VSVAEVDLDQWFVLWQVARRGPRDDCANLPAVVEAAVEQSRIGLVLADELDGERNQPDAPSFPARLEFQSVSLVASIPFLEMSTELDNF
jgi:hypothetical protein